MASEALAVPERRFEVAEGPSLFVVKRDESSQEVKGMTLRPFYRRGS
jgi:hypothetical protein